MPDRIQPLFNVIVKKRDAIPRRTRTNYTIADRLHAIITRDRQDGAPGSSNDTIKPDTSQTGPVTNLNGQDVALPGFAQLSEVDAISLGGTVQEGISAAAVDGKPGATTGLILRGRRYPFNSVVVIGDETTDPLIPSTDPDGDPAYDTLEWEPSQPGSAILRKYWQRCMGDRVPHCTRLCYFSEMPNRTIAIHTKTDLPADISLEFEIDWRGKAAYHKTAAGARVAWGNGAASLVWREGGPPSLEYFEGEWKTWRKFADFPNCTFAANTVTRVLIRQINDEIVINIDGKQYDVLRVIPSPSIRERYEVTRATWPKGKIEVTGWGTTFVLAVSEYRYLKPLLKDRTGKVIEKDGQGKIKKLRDVVTGLFSRRLDWPETTVSEGTAKAFGWIKRGTKAKVEVAVANGKINYTCTMEPDPSGIYTPFVTKVGGVSAAEYALVTAPELDIAPWCLTGSETTAEAGVSNGSQWSLEWDAARLAQDHPEWQEYITSYNPIWFGVRWQNSDLTETAKVWRLKGFIEQLDIDAPGAGIRTGRMTLADMSKRLMGINAKIDHKFYPMDFLIPRKTDFRLFGADIVKELMAIQFGEALASQFNGNGDPLRFFPVGHYPLVSFRGDTLGYMQVVEGPVQGDQWLFPPPWGEDVMSWINRIAGQDFGSFYWGFPQLGSSSVITTSNEYEPLPIYGYYDTLVAAATTWQGSADDWDNSSFNQALHSFSVGTIPEWMINNVLCWGELPGSSNPGMMAVPSIIAGQARLFPPDPNAAEYSWERTLILKGSFIQSRAMAQALARATIYQWMGVDVGRFVATGKGEPFMQWGDKYQPELLGAAGPSTPKFRIVRLQNKYNFQGNDEKSYQSTLHCAPLSAQGV